MEEIKVIFEYPENVLVGNRYSSFYKFVRTLWFKKATMQNVIKVHIASESEGIKGRVKAACNRFGIELIENSLFNIEFTPVIHRYSEDIAFDRIYEEIIYDLDSNCHLS